MTEMLSKLEELVLISVLKLRGDAYGTSIYTHIVGLTGREVTVSNVYFPLERLMRKGFLLAVHGEPTPRRGGMAKRYYRITKSGLAALQENRALNLATWRGVATLIKRAEV